MFSQVTIQPGQTVPFREDAIGDHCAKHFVTLMMIKDGKDADLLNETARAEYLGKCLKSIEGAASTAGADGAYMEALKQEALKQARAEVSAEKPKAKKAPAKKKAAKKEEPKEKKEEEFEGLEK